MQTINKQDIRSTKITGLIPARWQSSRFEGKPLEPINGIPMIQRVYNQCTLAEYLNIVLILTDDERIERFCKLNGMPCLMINDHCQTGTDRCAKAVESLEGDFFVNIQGDEPVIEPSSIDSLVENFLNKIYKKRISSSDEIHLGNAYTEIKDYEKLNDKNVVKVVFDKNEKALFFSRLPLPHSQGNSGQSFQQLGLYIYSRQALKVFSDLPRLALERSEGVELLRFLENGYSVQMSKVNDVGLSVDVPEDIGLVEEYLNSLED